MRTNYEIYRQMMEMIPIYERLITEYFEHRDYKVYTVFLSVANEETGTYFADIEVGGSSKRYHRYYGEYSLDALSKIMNDLDEDDEYGKELYDDYSANCYCDTYGVCGGISCEQYYSCHA